jgi:hypothetical protein
MRAIDYFDNGADAFPERAGFIDRGTSYSYREAKEERIMPDIRTFARLMG